MMYKQKVIFLTSLFPFPTRSGAALRDAGAIHALSSAFRLEIICVQSPGSEAPPLPPGIPLAPSQIHFVRRTRGSSWRRLLGAFRPYVINGYSQEVEAKLAQLYEPGATLWISRLALAQYIPAAHKIGFRTILDQHNVESGYYWQAIRKNWKWNEIHLALQLEKWERKFCQLAGQVVATSERDAKLLQTLCPGITPTVIANSVPLPPARPATSPPREILFVGTLDYQPNNEGLTWFLRSCWPSLRARGRSLTVVGARPPRGLLAEIEKAGVSFFANAEDLAPFYERAALCIAPIFSGGGTRLKILEALAWGRAVVSTTKGAEGLGFGHEREILLADRPEDFTSCVELALANPLLARKIGAAGFERVKNEFSWQSQAKAIEALLAGRLANDNHSAHDAHGRSDNR